MSPSSEKAVSFERVLERILACRAPAAPLADLADFWERRRAATDSLSNAFLEAIAGGAVADRVGYAFASGYCAATSVLVASPTRGRRASLLASEDGGAHPRAITTSLTRRDAGSWELRGKKRWATLASQVDRLLVVASLGVADGRNRLALVSVSPAAAGVSIDEMPPTPFAPEIPHAEVTLEGVVIPSADVFPGDGYADYVKPFRTIEDIHVHGALLAYVLATATASGWPTEAREDLVCLLQATAALADAPPLSPTTHVALAGLVRATKAALLALDDRWAGLGAGPAARWQRDRPLLEVAGGARRLRTEAAWRSLALTSDA